MYATKKKSCTSLPNHFLKKHDSIYHLIYLLIESSILFLKPKLLVCYMCCLQYKQIIISSMKLATYPIARNYRTKITSQVICRLMVHMLSQTPTL